MTEPDNSMQRRAGAILSYVSLVVNAITSFIYVPVLLGVLTTSEYGVYELIGSIISYLSVMDMGLSTTLSRFYVKTSVAHEEAGVENLLSISAIIYAVLTALSVLAGIVILLLLEPLFCHSFSPQELSLARRMMALVIANCVVVLPGNWFLALINAQERFVFARSLSIIKYVLQITTILVVLNWHPSALWVLGIQILFNLIAVIGYVLYCRRKLKIRARFHRWDGHLALSLFSFSFFILLNMVFNQIFWKTGQVVLGTVSGAVAVAVYGITTKIVMNGYMQVSTGITNVFLPRLTAIAAQTDDMAEINDLFNRIGHLQAILVWGICGAFIVLGRDFVTLWAGIEFSDSYVATVILMLGLSVALIQNLGLSVLQAKNKLGFRATVYIMLAVLDVIISIPVSRRYGVIGCASVAALLLFIGTGPVINTYYARVIRIDIGSFWRTVIPVLAPVVGASFATYLLRRVTTIGSWQDFLVHAGLFIIIYVGLLMAFGFNAYERGLIRAVCERFTRKG